jgi:hypothetical protein
MRLDVHCAAYLEDQVFPRALDDDTNGSKSQATKLPMDHKARLALQKQRQQQAMAAMMQRQAQFAKTMMMSELEEKNDDEETNEANDGAMEGQDQVTSDQDKIQSSVVPECIICSHVKACHDPIMYIGLAQKSTSLR